MNGRVYDPFLGRFTSSDPTIPGEWNGQAYNRLTYVLGNPMRLVDPTGFAPNPALGPLGTPNADGAGGSESTQLDDIETVGTPYTNSFGVSGRFATVSSMSAFLISGRAYLMWFNPPAPAPRDPKDEEEEYEEKEIPQCEQTASDSDWSVSAGGYLGPGGELTFGSDSGQGFVTARVGFGLGGGVSWSSDGDIPGPSPAVPTNGGFALSTSGQLNLDIGPIGANAEFGLVRNITDGVSAFFGGISGSVVGDETGIHASASFAGQATYYGGRPNYYAATGPCRL